MLRNAWYMFLGEDVLRCLYFRNVTTFTTLHQISHGKRNQYPPPRLPMRPL